LIQELQEHKITELVNIVSTTISKGIVFMKTLTTCGFVRATLPDALSTLASGNPKLYTLLVHIYQEVEIGEIGQ
jgi:hypothetical protein